MRLLAWALLLSPAAGARVLTDSREGIGARRKAFVAGASALQANESEDPTSDALPVLPPEWQRRLKVSKRLAGGAYGTVYKVEVTCGHTSTAELAMKVMRPSFSCQQEVMALQEMHGVSDYCSSSVGSPAHVLFQGRHYVLVPFMNHGDLHSLVSQCLENPACRCGRKRGHPLCWEALGPPFSEAFVLALVLQVMKGLQALHQHHLIHMDMKLENVMLHCEGATCYSQVVDLGLVCREHSDCLTRGTIGYIAPEVWSNHNVAVPANDVFSLGVILYILELGVMPRFKDDETGAKTLRYRPGRDTNLRGTLLGPLTALIERMLDPSPTDRISLKEAQETLRAVILQKDSSQAIRDMIEKLPEKAGAKAHLPDCVDDSGGMRAIELGPTVLLLVAAWSF